MLNQQQIYTLWPLSWWQNPWYVMTLAGIGILACGLGLIVFSWWKKRTSITLTNEERLMKGLQDLLGFPYQKEEDCRYGYGELVLIIREYAALWYGVSSHGLTDDEFIRLLCDKDTHESSQEFILLAKHICDEAVIVKFDAHVLALAKIRAQIETVIQCIESMQKQRSTAPSA